MSRSAAGCVGIILVLSLLRHVCNKVSVGLIGTWDHLEVGDLRRKNIVSTLFSQTRLSFKSRIFMLTTSWKNFTFPIASHRCSSSSIITNFPEWLTSKIEVASEHDGIQDEQQGIESILLLRHDAYLNTRLKLTLSSWIVIGKST
jgi:hypothetical protein